MRFGTRLASSVFGLAFGLGGVGLSCSSAERPAPIQPSDAGISTGFPFDASADVERRDVAARCYPAQQPFGIDPEFSHSFPDFSFLDCAGSVIGVDEMRCKNELTLVSIGAGWCEPCEAEALILEDLHQRFAARGLGVVQLMYEDRQGFVPGVEFCGAWQREFSLSYPVYVDPQSNTLEFMDTGVTPLNLLLNTRGHVLWAGFGVLPQGIDQYITELLR